MPEDQVKQNSSGSAKGVRIIYTMDNNKLNEEKVVKWNWREIEKWNQT